MEILPDPTPDMLAMPRFDDGAIDMQELIRRLAEQVVNAVMDAEADQLCGGGANSRNGYRERSLATCVGTLTLRIPKLRSGQPTRIFVWRQSLRVGVRANSLFGWEEHSIRGPCGPRIITCYLN